MRVLGGVGGAGGLFKVLEGGYVSGGASGGVLKVLEGGYGGGWVVVRGTPKSLWGFLWGWVAL